MPPVMLWVAGCREIVRDSPLACSQVLCNLLHQRQDVELEEQRHDEVGISFNVVDQLKQGRGLPTARGYTHETTKQPRKKESNQATNQQQPHSSNKVFAYE